MKKLTAGIIFLISISHLYAGEDIKDKPSGFYIDQDNYKGKKFEDYHSQLMNPREYKQHLLFAVDSILSDFCNPEKFNEVQSGKNQIQDYAYGILSPKQKESEQKLCNQIEVMPINTVERKLAIINFYKDFICNRNISNQYNKNASNMNEEAKQTYLSNCLSNPKELTFKELLEYNQKNKNLSTSRESISIVDSVLGTMPPKDFGFNFGEMELMSEPGPGVWNFEENKSPSEFDGISLEEAMGPRVYSF